MQTSTKTIRSVQRTCVWLLLVSGAVVFAIPFLWMVRIALVPDDQIDMGLRLLADWSDMRYMNFATAMTVQPFHRYFLNTYIITILGLCGEVLASSFVAYGFARKQFPGKNMIFIFMLATMMLPPQVTMIPVFILFRTFGWVDTILPLTVPSLSGAAFSIFLLRQFFMTIPRDYDDAADIDGCNSFQIYSRIILPSSKPALLTVVIFSFIGRWNDLLGPLIYLNSPDKYTLQLGLMAFRGLYSTQWNLLMAASIVVMLPCLVLFFVAQRYFISGILIGGLKE